MLIEILAVALTLSAQKPTTEAQAPAQTDEGRLEACLANARQAESCIGVVSNACQEDPGGYTTYGMMECERREHDVWDRRLNAAYRDMRIQLAERGQETRRDALQTAQRLWLEYRQAECEQLGLAYEGGSIAGVVHNSCYNYFTARRALELEGQLSELNL